MLLPFEFLLDWVVFIGVLNVSVCYHVVLSWLPFNYGSRLLEFC